LVGGGEFGEMGTTRRKSAHGVLCVVWVVIFFSVAGRRRINKQRLFATGLL
jgi:hypothetical protein